MDKWQYGDAGDRYPVKYGEVWQAGNHRFACLDLETYLLDRFLAVVPDVDLVYCDPPYNQALANGFRTKAGATGKTDFRKLLTRILSTIGAVCSGVATVEMGRGELDTLKGLVRATGGKVLKTWDITYNKKNAAHLVACTWRDRDIDPIVYHLDGMDDLYTPAAVMEIMRPKLVFDPCVGRGLTARAADDAGAFCYGIEINPRRLACTLDRFTGKYEISRVDVL